MNEFSSCQSNRAKVDLVYGDEFVSVHQPDDLAVPGMYMIQSSQCKDSILDLGEIEFELFTYLQRQLRIGLKRMHGVDLCGIYMEQHPGRALTSYIVPFHIDRLVERFSVNVYQPHIADYLKSFTSPRSLSQIEDYNASMKSWLGGHSIKHDLEMIKRGEPVSRQPTKSNRKTMNSEEAPAIEAVLEVNDETELPQAPEGKKYFVCIGGSKNFQCFLCDSRLSKGEFLQHHEAVLDSCLRRVYSDEFVIVRQDAKYAIPGFYIVSPISHYRSIDELPQHTYDRCMLTARNIVSGLATLGIARAHIYHDEKLNSPASAHFWVLPLHEDHLEAYNLEPTISSRDIWTYLDKFPRYSVSKERIRDLNRAMETLLIGPQRHW